MAVASSPNASLVSQEVSGVGSLANGRMTEGRLDRNEHPMTEVVGAPRETVRTG